MVSAVTYIGLALFSSILVFVGTIMMVFDSMRASQTLFRNMLLRIMRATPRFFDITPLGRIISRSGQSLLLELRKKKLPNLFLVIFLAIIEKALVMWFDFFVSLGIFRTY